MNVRRSLESRIRGWLPKEPNLPTRDSPIQKMPKENISELNEAERMSMSLLSVIGVILMGFSIYVFLVDPLAWRLAWVTNVSFVLIGVIAIALIIFICGRSRRQMS